MYIVEQKPVRTGWNKRGNPITVQMRKLAVGESFLVPYDDPNWTGNQVRNESGRDGKRYTTVREEAAFVLAA